MAARSPVDSDPSRLEVPLGQSYPPGEEQDDYDIYRGGPPSEARPLSVVSSTSSSTSSASFLTGTRLGTIAAALELAIARWARSWSAGSPPSSSSKSTSSLASIQTLSRSQTTRRWTRQPNSGSMLFEREIVARLKAREESRQIPRQFSLYLPPPTSPGADNVTRVSSHPQRWTCTSSLSLVLSQLDATLNRSSKVHRNNNHGPTNTHQIENHPPNLYAFHHHYMIPDQLSTHTPSVIRFDVASIPRKDKHRHQTHGLLRSGLRKHPPDSAKKEFPKMPKAWWLDVSSPNWEDMRAIGKLLHLHPLTLEDILQQECREKFELFPKLGYHLIVFRAIESQKTRERFRRDDEKDGATMDEPNVGGKIGVANIYLVVFRGGICSFHFTDISEHTERIRNRVFQLEETTKLSSDWIAHGILDSVVDSYFPLLQEIEREIVDVEEFVFSQKNEKAPVVDLSETVLRVPPGQNYIFVDEKHDDARSSSMEFNEKTGIPSNAKLSLTRGWLPLPSLGRFIRSVASFLTSHNEKKSLASHTRTVLRRMGRTRQLVTSLTRLLATKSEVVTQLRKRLLTTGQSSSSGTKIVDGNNLEVAMYMGDVHDHILTLQNALAHCERMLSQSHPTYLSQLRHSIATNGSHTDLVVMLFTVSIMGDTCMQTMIGMFSLNVTVPANSQYPNGRYNVFIIVIVLCITVFCAYLGMVRCWWIQAKKKRGYAYKAGEEE